MQVRLQQMKEKKSRVVQVQREIASQLLQRARHDRFFVCDWLMSAPTVDENLPKSDSSSRKSAIASAR